MSLAQVAERAGVSAATVSRVINNDPRVRPATASAVRAAIDALGYQPPSEEDRRRSRSRSRVGQHTGRVALLFPDTHIAALRTPLSGQLLTGMDAPLAGAGLSLTLTRLPRQDVLPACLNRRHLDGVMVRAAVDVPAWLVSGLRGLPHVWLFDTGSTHVDSDVILPDNDAVARLAAEHLAARGRQRPLVFHIWPEHPEMARRHAVFCELRPDALTVSSLDELEQVLAAEPRPDAVFNVGPEPLAALHHLIKAAGYTVGGDLDLVVCTTDDTAAAALEPRPTNIDIGAEAIGRAGAEALLWRMANPDEPARRLQILPTLVPGD